MKKNNRITILILAILVFLDISVTYFIKKQDNSFTFSKIKVFNEDINIEKNKHVYIINLKEGTLTCKKDKTKYDKVFDIKVKDKDSNGIEIFKEGDKKLYYYGYLDINTKKDNILYYDFLIEVDLEEPLKVSEECE